MSWKGRARASEEPEADDLAVRELPRVRLVPPNDPINADILERGLCVHSKLKEFNLIVSGRDWCNLFTEIRQKQIDLLARESDERREVGPYFFGSATSVSLRVNVLGPLKGENGLPPPCRNLENVST